MTKDQANPNKPPVVDSGTHDPKTSEHIDNLYRNCKQMVLLTCLGVFVPIVLIFAAPLGLLYAFQRSRLLKKVSEGNIVPSTADTEKVSFLRRNSWRFYAPAVLVGFWFLCLLSIVATL